MVLSWMKAASRRPSVADCATRQKKSDRVRVKTYAGAVAGGSERGRGQSEFGIWMIAEIYNILPGDTSNISLLFERILSVSNLAFSHKKMKTWQKRFSKINHKTIGTFF